MTKTEKTYRRQRALHNWRYDNENRLYSQQLASEEYAELRALSIIELAALYGRGIRFRRALKVRSRQ